MTKDRKPDRSADADAAIEFLGVLFDKNRVKGPIFFTSLANDKPPVSGEKSAVDLCPTDRDPERIRNFIETWDREHRGLFFCVSTISDRRAKKNCLATIGIWCDVDYKGVDASSEEIDAAIARLRCKPTIIVKSGHGVHLYWLFDQALPAQENQERIEVLCKLVCDHLAGDPAVCEISRLMRLPGTHNTKWDSWVPVVCTQLDGPRYTIERLEQWLGSSAAPQQKPVLRRRAGPDGDASQPGAPHSGAPHSGAPHSSNPFIRAGEEYGYRPPIDVDALLDAMVVGANVHTSQVSATSALIERGVSVDETVDRVLEATQKLAGTEKWDWRKEQRKLHNMCLTWCDKRGRKNAPAAAAEAQEPPQDKAQDAPKEKASQKNDRDKKRDESAGPKPGGPKAGKKSNHLVIGRGILNALEERNELLIVTKTGPYWYLDGVWYALDDNSLRMRLGREFEQGTIALGIKSTNRLCSEVIGWLMRQPEIYRPEIVFDVHGKIPVLNGLLDPRTGKLEPAKPEHYTTWRIDYTYSPDAKCPLWIQTLQEILGERDDVERDLYVALIQELVGLGLTNSRGKGMARVLILIGGANAGKSVVLAVISELFGGNPNTTPLSALTGTHALMRFLTRRPWILNEAFDDSVWHLSSTVKLIISGEEIQINPKYRELVDRRIEAPSFWATNHQPQFKEPTRAIIDRMALVPCHRTFNPNKPDGVGAIAAKQGYLNPAALVIETEMEGVLAWAVAGLTAVVKRGQLEIPQESQDMAERILRRSNTALDCFEDCVELDPDTMVSSADLKMAFRSWCKEEHDRELYVERFISSISSLPYASCIASMRSNSQRFWVCMRLNDVGLKHFEFATKEDRFGRSGKTANVSETVGEVNRKIPANWVDSLSVLKAKAAQKNRRDTPVTSDEKPVTPPDTASRSRHDGQGTENKRKPLF